MRKIGAFSSEVDALGFIQHLQERRITALIEEDQGSFAIWVHDEGHIPQAKKLFGEVESKGSDFLKKSSKKIRIKKKIKLPNLGNRAPPGPGGPALGYITKGLLVICTAIFLFANFQKYSGVNPNRGMISLPPVAKALLIDFPVSEQILEELVDTYGIEKVKENKLPSSADALVAEFNSHIPWHGLYHIALASKTQRDRYWHGEMFAMVKKGEVWRLFTPAILHMGLLHFLFNMLWLVVLGKMLEFNMGKVRFLLFILITGIFSNLCQYFMTGPYFMGISGVLSAFIGYIWVRKKIAPWEVYLLGKETLYFFLIYILGFLAFQVVAFFLQFFAIYNIPLSIANTGHISGLLAGLFLGRIGILSKKA